METVMVTKPTVGQEHVEEVVQELMTSLIGKASTDVQPLPSTSSMTLASTPSPSTAATNNISTNTPVTIISKPKDVNVQFEKVEEKQTSLETKFGKMDQKIQSLVRNIDPQPLKQGTGDKSTKTTTKPKLLLRPLLKKAAQYQKKKAERSRKSEKPAKTRGKSTCGFPGAKVTYEGTDTDSDDSY